MKAEEISQAISHYRWLAGIVKKYDENLYRFERRRDDIEIAQIGFYCCGDRMETVEFNTHRTIDPEPFINAIKSCIDSLKQEMAEQEKKYDMIDFSDLEPYDM